MSQGKINFILFCIVLLFVGFAGVSYYFFNADTYYSRPYTPIVKRSVEQRSLMRKREEDVQGQPRPLGLRESEIKKRQGEGYRTY